MTCEVERLQFLLPTHWLNANCLLARLDFAPPAMDLSAPQIREQILRWAATHKGVLILAHSILQLDLAWAEDSEIRKLGSRLRVQLNSVRELHDFNQRYAHWYEWGFGVELLIDRRPSVQDLTLASGSGARVIYGQNPLFPLDRVTVGRLDQLAPGWKIWFPPAAHASEALYSAREMRDWLKHNPERSADLLVLESLDGPLCPWAGEFFHDLQSDPLGLHGLSRFRRLLVTAIAHGGFAAKLAMLWLFVFHLITVQDLLRLPAKAGWLLYPVYKNSVGFLYAKGITIYWRLYRVMHWKFLQGLVVRAYWRLVQDLLLLPPKVGWLLYPVYKNSAGFLYAQGTTIYWLLYPVYKNSVGFLYAQGTTIYWRLYRVMHWKFLQGLVVRAYWQLVRAYWRLYRCVKFLAYPLRKFYWFSSYQFHQRLLPLVRRRTHES
jgi:hypothetical protein